MKKNSAILINNSYDADSAKSLITELLSFKINYLNLKKFGEEERKGTVSKHLEDRIIALVKTRNELNHWFEQLEGNPTLHISLDLKIEAL